MSSLLCKPATLRSISTMSSAYASAGVFASFDPPRRPWPAFCSRRSRSLTNSENSMGDSTWPWGRPRVTHTSDVSPSTVLPTVVRPFSISAMMDSTGPRTPMRSSLSSRRAWLTESYAPAKSTKHRWVVLSCSEWSPTDPCDLRMLSRAKMQSSQPR